jgi:N-acetylglucosamine-6-phosphate deacetylase
MGEDLRAIVVHGGTLVDADGERARGWLVTRAQAIVAVGSGEGWRGHTSEAAEVIDAQGGLITPGFVDIHGHGGGGASFGSGADQTSTALAAHRAHGTTHALASLVSNPMEVLEHQLRDLRAVMDDHPQLWGAHLEGPFLAPERKGAHVLEHLRHPTGDLVSRLLAAGAGVLRQITVAPELPGAEEAIERFVDAGVVVAIGHTCADHDTARRAFDRGATLVTHAFNAVNGIASRAPGPLVAAFADERVTLELIADGVHVDPRLLALAFRMAPGRIALVTDAMAAAGCGEGEYTLGELTVSVRAGRVVLVGTETLAGSVLMQDHALRVVVGAGVSLSEAIAALTTSPARVMGQKRSAHLLRVGASADVVVMDADLAVRHVIAGGALVRNEGLA